MNKVFFYIRVSTKQQNEQLQLDAVNKFIKENNIDDPKIYIDKSTGTNIDRPEFKAMLKAIGKGDLLWIWSLDRLSRNYNDCKKLWSELTSKGIDIVVDTMPILDTRTYKDTLGSFINDLIVTILGYVGQQETELRKERATAGYNSMRVDNRTGKRISSKTGKVVGRPVATIPKNFKAIVQLQQNRDITLKEALNALDMKKSTYFKYKEIMK